MGYQVKLLREANRELKLVECFFETWNKKNEFLGDFNHQIERIEENPLLFQVRCRNIRIIKFEHFSYSVHFTIMNQEAIVVAILGQNQSY